MIELDGLTKRYGDKLAVDDLTVTIRTGIVTGFLGPNGAGKSTTMRMVLGLDAPTAGTALVNGRPYAQHPAPLHEVGALLEAKGVHPGRTARAHLQSLAATGGVSRTRVDVVLELAGITAVADRRVGGFSLGMGQRLGVAAALLGDPAVVMLDEPVNGLDPDGVLWIRRLTRSLAAEGRTVFLSSHLMNEMAMTADHLVVVGRGRLQADMSTADFIASAGNESVEVHTPRASELRDLLVGPDVSVSSRERHQLSITGLASEAVGDIAAAAGIPLHQLVSLRPSLEDAFMALTSDVRDYRTDARTDARTDQEVAAA